MTRVRLGRKLWKVESAKPKALCDCKGKCKKHHMGECDYENQAIRVRDKQGERDRIYTSIHEGIHAQEPTWSEAKVKRRASQLTALVVEALTK